MHPSVLRALRSVGAAREYSLPLVLAEGGFKGEIHLSITISGVRFPSSSVLLKAMIMPVTWVGFEPTQPQLCKPEPVPAVGFEPTRPQPCKPEPSPQRGVRTYAATALQT